MRLPLALTLLALAATPTFAQEPPQQSPAIRYRQRPPTPPTSPEPAEPSPPQQMEVPGEVVPGGPTAIANTRLAIKNTTRDSLACTLAVSGQASRALTLGPGQEVADEFRSYPDLALTCPASRRAAYAPLLLGKRYVFLRLGERPQLVEVAPPPPGR